MKRVSLHYAHDRLREINSLRIIGQTKNKGPIVSFEMKGAHPHDVATIIDRSGVAVRAGTHCVMPLLKRFGVTATCRASFAMYNTREEIDALRRRCSRRRLSLVEVSAMTEDVKIDETPSRRAAATKPRRQRRRLSRPKKCRA